MDRKYLIGHTRTQLLALAKSFDVRGRHKMARAQLIEVLAGMVLAADGGQPELPSAYGKTSLTLLEVDPNLAHAFWEVAVDERRLRESQDGPSGTSFWVLRFYSNGNGVQNLFDEEISLSAGNWYVRLRAPHKISFAELGLKAPSGSFKAICRSNQVGLSHKSELCGSGWLQVEASGVPRPASDPHEKHVLSEFPLVRKAPAKKEKQRESSPSSHLWAIPVSRKA
jgi:hypothetical protein